MKQKPSLYLAALAWLSVFILSWLLLLRTIPADSLTWYLFAMFTAIAVLASATASPKA